MSWLLAELNTPAFINATAPSFRLPATSTTTTAHDDDDDDNSTFRCRSAVSSSTALQSGSSFSDRSNSGRSERMSLLSNATVLCELQELVHQLHWTFENATAELDEQYHGFTLPPPPKSPTTETASLTLTPPSLSPWQPRRFHRLPTAREMHEMVRRREPFIISPPRGVGQHQHQRQQPACSSSATHQSDWLPAQLRWSTHKWTPEYICARTGNEVSGFCARSDE